MSEKFKVGDVVYVIQNGKVYRRAIISRVTKTLACVEIRSGVEVKYSQDSGYFVPSSEYPSSRISHPTPQLDVAFAESNLRKFAQSLSQYAQNPDTDVPTMRLAFDKWEASKRRVEKLKKNLEES